VGEEETTTSQCGHGSLAEEDHTCGVDLVSGGPRARGQALAAVVDARVAHQAAHCHLRFGAGQREIWSPGLGEEGRGLTI
jgi:hypothetical protein